MAQFTGTTTNSWASVFEFGDTDAVACICSLKNTGSNTVSIKLTLQNAYGGNQNDTFLVLPGGIWSESSVAEKLLGLDPCYSLFRVEVKSTVVGLHSTYDCRAIQF